MTRAKSKALDVVRSTPAAQPRRASIARNLKTDDALPAYRRAELMLSSLPGSAPAVRTALVDCRTRMALLFAHAGKYAWPLAALRRAQDDQEASPRPGGTVRPSMILATTPVHPSHSSTTSDHSRDPSFFRRRPASCHSIG